MSNARDKLLAEFDRYIAAMKGQGKTPSALYVTKDQWNRLALGLHFQADSDGTPHYKGTEVKVHG